MVIDYIGINWYDLCQAFENSLFRYYHKKCKNGNDLESLRLMHSSNEDNSNRREVTDADVLLLIIYYQYIVGFV